MANSLVSVDSATHQFPTDERATIAANLTNVETVEGAAVADLMGANARSYGAIGDGVSRPLSTLFGTLAAAQAVYPTATALTNELDWAAITTCISERGGAYLPVSSGSYMVNLTIDLASGEWLRGDPGRTRILQSGTNLPILTATATMNITNLRLTYSAQQTSSHTNSNGIRITDASSSVIRNVRIEYAARGIYNVAPGYCFSVTFQDISIGFFSITAFDIGNSGGITGNVVSNMYIHNNPSGVALSSTEAPVKVAGWDEGTFTQLNVEHVKASRGISVNNCGALTFNATHIEGFTMLGTTGGVIDLANSNDRVMFNGLSVIGSSFLIGDIPLGDSALFKLVNNCVVTVNGFEARTNTVTISDLALVWASSVTTARAVFDQSIRGEFTVDQVGDVTALPVVASYNGDQKYIQYGGKVLSDRIRLDAPMLGGMGGSPTLSAVGGVWAVWFLDAAANETVGAQVDQYRIAGWNTFKLEAEVSNAAAGAGDYVLRAIHTFRTTGDTASAGFTTGSQITTTAAAQDVLQSVTLVSSAAVTANKPLAVQVSRRATDVGDTLANDVSVSALILTRLT